MHENDLGFRTQLDHEILELKAVRKTLQQEFERLAGPELPNMLKGRKETEVYLEHVDPNCRCASLTLLTDYWKVGTEVTSVIEEIGLNDPDIQVRCVALFCLGSTYRGQNNARVGRLFAQLARNESQDPRVREAAYKGLLDLRNVPIHQRPPIGGFQLQAANWTLVDSFLEGES